VKRILLFVFLIFATTALQAQTPTIDGNWLILRYIDYQLYRLELQHPDLGKFKLKPEEEARIETNAWEWLGFIQAIFSFEETDKNAPNGFSVGDIGKIIGKYATEHPEEWSQPATWIALKAVNEAWRTKRGARI
jgi:hypothetical protein